MRKFIYRIAQKLYQKKLLPMFIWSPIYDRFHKLFQHGEQW